MHVRKFEANSLEEALQEIKQELGPDAIILKTTTNRGLKGAFKKNRIEITAAISEKSYVKKAKVDRALTQETKEQFYSSGASHISNMIDSYSGNQDSQRPKSEQAYSQLGVNRQVKTTKNEQEGSDLDSFLSQKVEQSQPAPAKAATRAPSYEEFMQDEIQKPEIKLEKPKTQVSNNSEIINGQQRKIEELETALYELTKKVEKINPIEARGLRQLRTVLRSLNIEDSFISKVIKKADFELSEEEIQDPEVVFEFALRVMMDEFKTDMPLFSKTDIKEPVVTIVISESTCGQTSMIQKLASLKKDTSIIKYRENQDPSLAEKVFDLETAACETIAEISSAVRKNVEKGISSIVDYKCSPSEVSEAKKFIYGLKRSFGKVEVLICISSINSELYNRKVVERYKSISDGVIATYLDLCLDYGCLFNISYNHQELPFKFFTTGEVIPEDIEAATSERILASLFKF